MKKRCIVIVSIILALILSFIVLSVLYIKGKIFSQDVNTAYNNVRVWISTEDEGKEYTLNGFFITDNCVVTGRYPELFDRKLYIIDVNSNIYEVVDKIINERALILKTNIKNKNTDKFFYGFTKDNEFINTCITSDWKLSKCKVIKANYEVQNSKSIWCKGNITGYGSFGAFDDYGRIIGMTIRSDLQEDFFVYPQYEIMRTIIVHEIKDFFGINE